MMADVRPASAWGLEIGEAEVRLAHVAREGGALKVLAALTAPLQWTDHGDPDIAAAVAAWEGPEPTAKAPPAVWVAVPDESVLYRTLTLPRADSGAVLAQMVRTQAEVALPLPLEEMAWGWARLPSEAADAESCAVTLAAAQKRVIDQVRQAAPWLRQAQFVPHAAAVAAVIAHALPGESRLALHVRPSSGTLTRVGPGGFEAARLAHSPRDMAAAGQALAGHHATPPAGMVLGENGSAAHRAGAALADALPQTLDRFTAPADWGVEVSYAPAVGAALHALAPPPVVLQLGDGAAPGALAQAPAVNWRRIGIAAAVAVAALLGWWALDIREASRREAAVTALREAASAAGGTQRTLAIGRYLENQPPPPLLILEAISSTASSRIQLREFHYDTAGKVRISGTVQGVAGLDETLLQFRQSPALRNVQMRSANIERDVWSFDVEADMMPLHRYLATRAARPTAAGNDSAAGGAR